MYHPQRAPRNTMNFAIYETPKHSDSRGVLVEFLRAHQLPKGRREFGQIYFVTFDSPSQVRGNHYHSKGIEWFGVAQGTVQVVLEDVETKRREEFVLRADDRSFTLLEVGPRVAHAFRNLTPTAVLLDYCTEQFDPQLPDRQPYILIPPS